MAKNTMIKRLLKSGVVMKFKIIKAKAKDCELVYQLTKDIFADYNRCLPTSINRNPALEEDKADVLSDIVENNVLLAYYNNEPVGSVRYSLLENGIYLLSRLGVLADYRGLKIGSQLVRRVEEEVSKKDGQGILLYSAKSAKRVLKFYDKLGYEIIDIDKKQEYKKAILYKELKKTKGEY